MFPGGAACAFAVVVVVARRRRSWTSMQSTECRVRCCVSRVRADVRGTGGRLLDCCLQIEARDPCLFIETEDGVACNHRNGSVASSRNGACSPTQVIMITFRLMLTHTASHPGSCSPTHPDVRPLVAAFLSSDCSNATFLDQQKLQDTILVGPDKNKSL